VIVEESLYSTVKSALATTETKVHSGSDALAEVVQDPEIDIVLTALVGYCGLLPTIKALEAGKDIALSNKETLVVAGELIMDLVAKHNTTMLPVDSEHSAIFQCLVGETHNPIEKIILTASGGPFRGKKADQLQDITKAQALKHPNWIMGAKITIDSASLMNKGLEVIEAKWLFGLDVAQVDVIVHPQSIIHSMVQFEDGSIKAQMGLPDMKLPIQFAMTYPERLKTDFPRFDFMNYPNLTFESPDKETFRNLALAFEVGEKGGNQPCVLNAANEIVVDAFLRDRVGFLELSDIIETTLEKVSYIRAPKLEDYIETDKDTRRLVTELIR